MGRYKEAIAEAQEAKKLDSNFPLAHKELGGANIGNGKPEKAIEDLTKAINRGPQHPRVKGMLGCAYTACGRRTEAEEVLKEMERLAPDRLFIFALPIARIYAALGDKDSALEWLNKAVEERDSSLFRLRFDPTLKNLRGDERFARLLAEMHLPP